MKKNKLTISVGITIYNEGYNIARLLASILNQVEINFWLKEIIIISDGSTDKTIDNVLKVKDKRIHLKIHNKRSGKSARLNEIFSLFRGDLLFLIDADILIKDKNLFFNIIKKWGPEKNQLISIKAEPIKARNFFERCINYSNQIKENIRYKWNDGNNFLAFRGCFMGLSRKFAKSLKLANNLINNDTFIYISAIRQSYKTKYFHSDLVYYKSPSKWDDHIRQSTRFQNSAQELEEIFSSDLKKQYKIPLLIILQVSIKYFLLNPFYFLGYFTLYIASKYKKTQGVTSTWDISLTTK